MATINLSVKISVQDVARLVREVMASAGREEFIRYLAQYGIHIVSHLTLGVVASLIILMKVENNVPDTPPPSPHQQHRALSAQQHMGQMIFEEADHREVKGEGNKMMTVRDHISH